MSFTKNFTQRMVKFSRFTVKEIDKVEWVVWSTSLVQRVVMERITFIILIISISGEYNTGVLLENDSNQSAHQCIPSKHSL